MFKAVVHVMIIADGLATQAVEVIPGARWYIAHRAGIAGAQERSRDSAQWTQIGSKDWEAGSMQSVLEKELLHRIGWRVLREEIGQQIPGMQIPSMQIPLYCQSR